MYVLIEATVIPVHVKEASWNDNSNTMTCSLV